MTMHWYLVNIAPQQLGYGKTNTDPTINHHMVYVTEEVPANTVCNKVVHDGIAIYAPPSNMKVVSSVSLYEIGDLFKD